MLKIKVQELINIKILSFKDNGPNVINNPLPGHNSSIINVDDEELRYSLIQRVEDVNTPLAAFHTRLAESILMKEKHEECPECTIHPK